MSKKQYYSIKFPFTSENSENYFIDLNMNQEQKVRSDLMHVIFTSKGSKLRDPEFGTDLIKYIFEPNDTLTWNAVKEEVSTVVQKYVSNVQINDISLMESEDDVREVYVRIDYSIKEQNKDKNDSIVIKI